MSKKLKAPKKSHGPIYYPCPSCGNDLYESGKYMIKCPYCRTVIITQCKKEGREADIAQSTRFTDKVEKKTEATA